MLAWLMLCAAATVHGQVEYRYSGATFTNAQPPYTVADRLAGQFTVALRLPPLQVLADISDLLTDYSFDDGQQTRTPQNTAVCIFSVATDGAGHVIQWRISLRESGVSTGNPHDVIDSSDFGDQVGTGPAPAGTCDSINLLVAADNLIEGSWQDDLPPPSPTTYVYTGAPFTSARPPYNTTQNVSGSFTLDHPLPPFTAQRDIAHALTGFTFVDGVQIRTPANSEVCFFEVATDGAGQVVAWLISLRELPHSPGNPQKGLDTTTEGDGVGSGLAGPSVCGMLSFNPGAATTNTGVWDAPLPPGSDTDYTYLGQPFSFVLAPYQTSDFVSGSIRFANPLPAYLTGADLSFALDDYFFDDGLQSFDPTNSQVCSLRLVTGGGGHILAWTVSLRERPSTPGQPQGLVDSSTLGDLSGSASAASDPCGMVTPDVYGTNSVAGHWSEPSPQPAVAVYLFSGEGYDQVDPPFLPGQRLSGRISLPGALPANLQLTDISAHIQHFWFFDPVQTRSKFDSEICTFEVATGASGEIVQWRVVLREQVFTTGLPQGSVDLVNLGLFGSDTSLLGSAGNSVCDEILSPTAATGNAGTWHQLCPALLAALSQWPVGLNVLGLVGLTCP